MSWSGSFAQNYVDPQHLQEAEMQYDTVRSMFARILTTCRDKCIPNNYHEPELNKGEQKCVDRCVVKYMSFQGLMAERLRPMAPGYNNTDNSGFTQETSNSI